MQAELSIIDLFLGASFVVQFVMIILLIISISSWWYIFDKWITLKRALGDIYEFESTFWKNPDKEKIFQDLSRLENNFGLGQIFLVVFEEIEILKKNKDINIEKKLERSIEIIINRQEEELERGLSFLSTVASVSPFIGLFGTVWGVMNAFSGLAQLSQVSINAVAPGISEALIATALGLFAAIPALISYNWSVKSIAKIITNYENYASELIISSQEYD